MERRGLLDIIGESVLPGLYGKETVGDRVAVAQQGLLDAYATGGNKGLFDYMKTPAYTGPMNELGGAFAGSVTGKAKALPMDEASRMARAREMGYHTDLYHGTGSDIPAFQDTRRGNWFTDRPEIANIYAEKSGPSGSDIRAINATADPNVMPVMLRGNVLEVSDLGPGGGGWLTDNLAQALGVKAKDFKLGNRLKELSALARSKGYSAIKINDMQDLGGVQSQWMLLDPSAVRSRFAAFDPAKADSADLLAARGPMTGPHEDERKRKK